MCEEEYELLDQIGRGSYGKVYRAQHSSGEVHAIKVREKSRGQISWEMMIKRPGERKHAFVFFPRLNSELFRCRTL